MKRLFTKLLALTALFLVTNLTVDAQLVTLVNSNFTDWTTAPTNNANGDGSTVYSIGGASILFKGTGYNPTSNLPGAGTTTDYPNFFRFGSNMSPQFPTIGAAVMSNQYLRISPTASFVNGGKITFYVSSNSSNTAFQVGDIASGVLLGEPVIIAANTISTVTLTLPVDYNGTKQIALGRKATGFFLYGIKIETNQAVASANTALSNLKIDGITVAGFDAATLTYNVALPFAYSGIPVVSAVTNDINASAAIVQANSIPGSATITVTATGVSPTVYTVNFTRIPVSTACDINSFSLNGRSGTIVDNAITVKMYPNTDVTALTPTVGVSALASYSPAGAKNFTNPVDYIVTAEDGITQKTYTVSIEWIAPYTGSYPYETTFPSDFTIPTWMNSPTNGISFQNPYTGSDASLWYETGETTSASVIRLNSSTFIEFYVSKCSNVTARLSATGTRTFNLYVNGVLKVTAASIAKNTLAELNYAVNLNEPVLISVENAETSGGATLGYLKIDSSFGTDISQSKISGISFDGQIIHNDAHLDLRVFDTTGRLMAGSNKDINMGTAAKGIYVVKSASGTLKIVL